MTKDIFSRSAKIKKENAKTNSIIAFSNEEFPVVFSANSKENVIDKITKSPHYRKSFTIQESINGISKKIGVYQYGKKPLPNPLNPKEIAKHGNGDGRRMQSLTQDQQYKKIQKEIKKLDFEIMSWNRDRLSHPARYWLEKANALAEKMGRLRENRSRIATGQNLLENPFSSKLSPAKLYEKFQGKKVDKTRTIEFQAPKALVTLGRAVAIEYECSKRNGVHPSKAGKVNTFRHEMPKGNILSTNENGTILIIRGPKLKIKKSGINH